MRDIVATIQADQDRIIQFACERHGRRQAGARGRGRPWSRSTASPTCSTSDRDRFEGRGVLVDRSLPAFTEYTARVLPSLGEDRAVQRPLEALAPPGHHGAGLGPAGGGAGQGGPAHGGAVPSCGARRAAPAAAGDPLHLRGDHGGGPRGSTLRRVRAGSWTASQRSRGGHLPRTGRDAAEDALRAALWRAWRSAAPGVRGQPTGRVRRHRVRRGDRGCRPGHRCCAGASGRTSTLRRFSARWRPGDTACRPSPMGILDADEVERLGDAWGEADRLDHRRRGPARRASGPAGGPSPADEGPTDVGARASGCRRDELRLEIELADVEADDYRDFAHVVVDEAQDLSPMQWRARPPRAPYASWTVVGDLAQRSRVAEPKTWRRSPSSSADGR
jgi:hypothetical protein